MSGGGQVARGSRGGGAGALGRLAGKDRGRPLSYDTASWEGPTVPGGGAGTAGLGGWGWGERLGRGVRGGRVDPILTVCSHRVEADLHQRSSCGRSLVEIGCISRSLPDGHGQPQGGHSSLGRGGYRSVPVHRIMV